MKFVLFVFSILGFISCRTRNGIAEENKNSIEVKSERYLADSVKRMHYFSTTKDEYNYITSSQGLLRFIKGLDEIRNNYILESVGIDGYTKERDIDLSYLMKSEGNKVLPCAFVVAFLENGVVVDLKCIPINNFDEDLTIKTRKDFKKIEYKWMPNLIELTLNLSQNYIVRSNLF